MTREEEVELVQIVGQMADQHNKLRNDVAALVGVLLSKNLVEASDLVASVEAVDAFVEQDQLLQRLKSFQGTLQ
jgi:hypothetical protein